MQHFLQQFISTSHIKRYTERQSHLSVSSASANFRIKSKGDFSVKNVSSLKKGINGYFKIKNQKNKKEGNEGFSEKIKLNADECHHYSSREFPHKSNFDEHVIVLHRFNNSYFFVVIHLEFTCVLHDTLP
jgi:hypothetical protein